jgi:hypothetical protein
MQSEQPASTADELLRQTADELRDLRFHHEKVIGRVLARLNFFERQREKARNADAARGVR